MSCSYMVKSVNEAYRSMVEFLAPRRVYFKHKFAFLIQSRLDTLTGLWLLILTQM